MPLLGTMGAASSRGFNPRAFFRNPVFSNDPFAGNLRLAMPLNTSLGINDYSASISGSGVNKTTTSVNSAAITTSFSKYYGGSLDVSPFGSLKYVSVPNDTNLHLTNQDFTIEMWVYLNANNVGYQAFATHAGDSGDAQNGWILYLEGNNTITFASSAGWAYSTGSSTIPSTGAWHHLAVSRSGNNLRMFFNGSQINTTNTTAGNINSPSTRELRLGNYNWFPGGSRSLSGYIQDFRLYIGVGKYTTTFTPPTAIASLPGGLSTTPAIWLDASSTQSLITSGSNVTQWRDISPNGIYHFNPSTTAPTTSGGGVLFGTTPSFVDNNAYSRNANTWTWIGVVNTTGGRSGPENFGRYFGASLVGQNDYDNLNGTLVSESGASSVWFYRNGGAMITTTPIALNTKGVWAARINGTEAALWKNTTKLTGTWSGNLNVNRLRIGNDWNLADSQLLGIVYEWVVYDGALSDSDVNAIVSSLRAKWSVP
jgi:hypothetical protein